MGGQAQPQESQGEQAPPRRASAGWAVAGVVVEGVTLSLGALGGMVAFRGVAVAVAGPRASQAVARVGMVLKARSW